MIQKNRGSIDHWVIGVVLLAAIQAGLGQSAGTLPPEVVAYADTIFYNGKIITADEQFTIAEAVAWAFAAAQKHLGKPHQFSKIEYWEIRNGYSITINLTESGCYQADIFPMWVDSDNRPVMGYAETFSTLDAALDFARNRTDETMRADTSYRQLLEEIRATMEANSR